MLRQSCGKKRMFLNKNSASLNRSILIYMTKLHIIFTYAGIPQLIWAPVLLMHHFWRTLLKICSLGMKTTFHSVLKLFVIGKTTRTHRVPVLSLLIHSRCSHTTFHKNNKHGVFTIPKSNHPYWKILMGFPSFASGISSNAAQIWCLVTVICSFHEQMKIVKRKVKIALAGTPAIHRWWIASKRLERLT